MNDPLQSLTVCPTCDALFDMRDHDPEQSARCSRCGYVLAIGQTQAVVRVLALAAASAVLMIVVVFTPFLNLSSSGLGSEASVYDVAFAFESPIMMPLAISVLLFSIVLPWARLGLLIYALGPPVLSWPPAHAAGRALRWAMEMRPWAMAEIFMIGVAVSLLKLGDLATLSLGLAFWAFALVVLLNAYKDAQMCRTALWKAVSR